MFRSLAAACFTGELLMSTATLRGQGAPVELHDHVITVYGGTGDWKQRLSYSPAHDDDACLVVLDREGVVRWLHHGGFDTSASGQLKALLASLARPVDR